MRKTTLNTAILLALGTVGLLQTAQAASIEEIVVTGGRIEESIPQELARYGNQVEVITAEQIQQSGFIDVAQTLQMLVPGLHIRPKNGQFDYFDASLQGSRTGDILWLIDGVRINNRLYNGTTPLDTVPAHMVERIEVLKGGQGIYYGTQSVGGVINVVTKSLQQEADGQVGANLNTNSGRGMNGYYRAGTDQMQYVVYASKDEVSDGYQPWRDSDIQPSAVDRERGYDISMAGMKFGFTPTESSLLSLHYQRTEGEMDYVKPFINVSSFNDRKEDIFTLKYDLQVNDNIGLFVKAYRHQWDTHFTDIRNTLSGGVVTGSLRYISNAAFWGYEDNGFNAMTKMDFGLGFEYIVGFDRQQFSGSDEVWRIAELEETVNAGFMQVRTTEDLLDNTMLAFGVRRNEPDNVASKTVWNFSGKHTFTDNLYIQANIGTSFRLPDAEMLFLNELYDDNKDGVPDDYFSVGNPNLKPEESENVNVSIGGSFGNLQVELTRFQRDITHYIESYTSFYIAGVEGESFSNTTDEVEVAGYELITSLRLTPALGTSFSYTNSSAELNGNGAQQQGIPENESKLQLNWQSQVQPLGVSFTVDHVGDLNERRGEKRGNYTVMDLSGHLELGNGREHSLVLRVENLADKVYATRVDRGTRDTTGVGYNYDNLGMERTLHASYTYRF